MSSPCSHVKKMVRFAFLLYVPETSVTKVDTDPIPSVAIVASKPEANSAAPDCAAK